MAIVCAILVTAFSLFAAIAGGGVPSFPVWLDSGGKLIIGTWATNKPAHLVEQDIERAVQRLRAGERFQLHCSGPQVSKVLEKLKHA